MTIRTTMCPFVNYKHSLLFTSNLVSTLGVAHKFVENGSFLWLGVYLSIVLGSYRDTNSRATSSSLATRVD